MIEKNKISFRIEAVPDRGVECVIPVIDEVDLVERVRAYEQKNKYTPAGGYGGLIPSFFNYGPLAKYFMGKSDEGSYWGDMNAIYVLACDCGEVGCWPLTCSVTQAQNIITWSDFGQEHRPNWDYKDFGPFIFDLTEYRQSLQPVAARFPPR